MRRHYLNDGDVVQLGKHELIYIDERLPRVRAPFVETVPGMPPPVRSPMTEAEGSNTRPCGARLESALE